MMSTGSWAGIPDDVMSAAKPQLAGELPERACERGVRAAFVTGDEVHGGRELRQAIRARGMGYMLAVRASAAVAPYPGTTITAAGAVKLIPGRAWQRLRTGPGTKASATMTGPCWRSPPTTLPTARTTGTARC
jgi:hypothetical protein